MKTMNEMVKRLAELDYREGRSGQSMVFLEAHVTKDGEVMWRSRDWTGDHPTPELALCELIQIVEKETKERAVEAEARARGLRARLAGEPVEVSK